MQKKLLSRQTSTHAIGEEWQRVFGLALPAGFLCRTELSDCWLRIHSLPESKRYPESDQEYAEMLDRQNTVAEYTLGEGSECILFFTRFGDAQTFNLYGLPVRWGSPKHVMSCDSEDEEDKYQFFALRVTWQRKAFDDLIVACANDQTGPILFANTATRSIYAPYDGGADLIFPSDKDALAAHRRFAKWLSAHPLGL